VGTHEEKYFLTLGARALCHFLALQNKSDIDGYKEKIYTFLPHLFTMHQTSEKASSMYTTLVLTT
jgi:hypothetical protein